MKVYKDALALILLLFWVSTLYSQNEFEGIIEYDHTIKSKNKAYNIDYDYSAIGYKSTYYYKDGNYKFENSNSYFKYDLFRKKDQSNFIAISGSDTIMMFNATIPDIEVIEYEIKETADTILNRQCDAIILKLKPINKETPVSYRRYYYPKKELQIDPKHFKNIKGNCYELIFSQTRALPLRIEFEWPEKLIIWQATKVTEKELDQMKFELEEQSIITKIN